MLRRLYDWISALLLSVSAMALLLWVQNVYYREQFHRIDAMGDLTGVGIAAGRIVFCYRNSSIDAGGRYELNGRPIVYRASYQRRGVVASDFDLWQTTPTAGAQIMERRYTSRFRFAGVAWEAGGEMGTSLHAPGRYEGIAAQPVRPGARVVVTPPPRPAPAIRGQRLVNRWAFLAVPLWCVALVAGALPVLRLPRVIRRYRSATRRGEGRCGECGYDLRASPGRCPECGASVVNAARTKSVEERASGAPQALA